MREQWAYSTSTGMPFGYSGAEHLVDLILELRKTCVMMAPPLVGEELKDEVEQMYVLLRTYDGRNLYFFPKKSRWISV